MKRLIMIVVMLLCMTSTVQAQMFGGDTGWTQGIAVDMNFWGESQGAWLVDQLGVVRASEDRTVNMSPVIAGHLLWDFFPWLKMGPGLAASLGDNIINGIGFQWVFGFVKEEELFTLGLGAWLTPNAVVLGPEFIVNQLAPIGLDGSSLPIRTVIKGIWTAQATFTMRLVNR